MRKYLYTIIVTAFCNLAFATGFSKTDSAVYISIQKLEMDSLNSNYKAILYESNKPLMSNVLVMYDFLVSKDMRKGSARLAEETLLKKSIPLSIKYGTDKTNYNCFMALAKCYIDQKKYTQAKWYYIQSNISAKKAKYPQGEVLSLMQLAVVKKIIGDDELALQDFKEAEKLAVKINFKSPLMQIRKSIAAFPGEKASGKEASLVASDVKGG